MKSRIRDLGSLGLSLALLAAHPAPAGLCQDDAGGEGQNLIARVGAAFAAKTAASAVFVSGRDLDSFWRDELAPDTLIDQMLAPLLELELDQENQQLTARVLGVSATALYREGLGCTLLSEHNAEELRQQMAGFESTAPPEEGWSERAWPEGDAPVLTDLPQNVDGNALQAALDYAFVEHNPRGKARTRAVVVVQHGQLLAERYADGFPAAMPLTGWSMTKSILHALIGIRMRQGQLDPQAVPVVPEWSGAQDPRRAITLDQLLRMSSGLEWNESYDDLAAGPAQMLFHSPDAGAFAAQSPLESPPDSVWEYSSGTTNIISHRLRSTFATLPEYLSFPSSQLFGPLGMHSAVMEPDPSGHFVGSSFCYATARDWARFGLLYAQDGVWQGKRLLPEAWVKKAFTPTPTASHGHYGRHWWLNAGPPGQPEQRYHARLPVDLAMASGFQGQTVAVIPSRDAVIVRLGCTKVAGAFDKEEFMSRVLAALP